MHFIAPAILFGLFSTATAAPSVDQAGHASVQNPNTFFAGSSSSACYCCPSIAGASGANCSPAKEDGRCSNNDVLICCDTREQACENLGTITNVDGTTGALNIGGLLNQLVDGLL